MKPRKLTKEDIDKVRNIEGFPIGTDEDIIALSDAPYYTACPNPFIEEFIKENGHPYDEVTDDYHREPFAADVSEGKTDPVYMAHAYHTKVPYKAILKYIMHYTSPGDIILDGFCGSGMTGIAAQKCGDIEELSGLGFTNEEISTNLGVRKAILNDLAPVATFISYCFNNPENITEYDSAVRSAIEDCKKEFAWMYKT